MKIEPRDYQLAAIDEVREHLRAGKRSVLVVAPTGSGKTVIASALMEMTAERGNRANFVVDRLSLIQQTSETLFRYGIEHGVVQSEHPLYRPGAKVQVCSVQTLAKRGWPESKVDFFDEAHVLHAAHKARMQHGGIVCGLTATPFTRGLGKHFDAVVNVTTTNKLIRDGWLAPYRAYSCAAPDMDGVRVTSMGEWDDKEASKKALEVVGDVVDEYRKHGQDRKFICSAVDTAHVEELQRQFLAAGINVASYTYLDKDEDREETLTEYRKRDSSIRGLITVTAASRGFDCPDIGVVIMARPLRKSLAEHIQLLGRGLRIAEGKTDCIVLDHSANMARFWSPMNDFFENGIDQLDDGKPKAKKAQEVKPEAEAVKCPQCRVLHKPMPFCPACGHQYPKRQTVQHVPGTLKEMIASGDQGLLRDRLWPQLVDYVASRYDDPEIQQRRAQSLYKDITGEFARARVTTTKPVPCSAEVRSRIRAVYIKWSHRREKPSQGASA